MKITPITYISSAVDPSNDFKILLKSLVILLVFWKWNRKASIKEAEEKVETKFHTKNAILFDRGRTALYYILKNLDIKPNDEVIIQAFTCEALVAPIVWLGAKPKFADVFENFNMNVKTIKKVYTKRTKAIIVQHTFGIPTDIKEIQAFCKQKKILLIEDLAHGIGGKIYSSPKEISLQKYSNDLGSFSVASFSSFNEDKKINTQGGGVVLTNNNLLAKTIRKDREKLSEYPTFLALRKILKSIFFYFAIRLYNFLNLGKGLIFILRKLRLAGGQIETVSVQILRKLKKNEEQKVFFKYHPVLAKLLVAQLENFKKHELHREKIVKIYNDLLGRYQIPIKAMPLLRYPILVPEKNKEKIIRKLKNISVQAGTWYTEPIRRTKFSLKDFQYKKGSCKHAEEICKKVINLPTHYLVTTKIAYQISNIVLKYLDK